MSAYVLRLDYWHYSIVREVAVTPGVKYGVLSSEVRYLSGMFFFYHDLSVLVNLDFLYDVPQSHSVNPSAWGHLNPSSYCDVGRLFYGVFKLWSKLQRKK